MRLTRISISNFRSIGDRIDILVPSQHVVLVGSNNSGKSNILSAIDCVLGNRSPYQLHASQDDFFDPTREIVIEAEIGEIGAADKTHLMGVATSQRQRGALMSSKKEPVVTLTLTLPPLERAEGSDEGQDEPSAAGGKVKLEVNLWGFSVYQKTPDLRRRLVQAVSVAATRNVGDDLQASRWTAYGQLMKSVLEGSNHYEEVRDLLDQINDKIQEVFAEEKAGLLSNARVVSYVDDIDFQLTKENNPAELLRYLEVFVTEGSRRASISQLGTGTQSAVIIGMFELVLRQRSSPVRVFAVEEPDAFVHPHGVRRLAGLVQGIGEDQGVQVIMSTHSPSLVAGLPPRDIVRVERGSGRTLVYQSPGTLSAPAFGRFVNQDTAEMFFAKRVILVEGDTERFLLPPLSGLISDAVGTTEFDYRQTSIVAMHSKDNIVNFLKILHEFKIDVRAILDNDFLGGSSCKALVLYLRGQGKTIDDLDNAALVKSLWAEGILVLQRGEIEDYVPEADVVSVCGQSLAVVQAELRSGGKTSNSFKKLFKAQKPVYARQLAEYYVAAGSAPADLEKLIKSVSR